MRPLLLWLSSIPACTCLPQPANDASAPLASVTLTFTESGSGSRVTRVLKVGDPNVTITADRDEEIKVLYSGSDNEGLREVHLVYDMWYTSGISTTQGLLEAIAVISDCPKKALAGTQDFGPSDRSWHYEFGARSTNWVGLAAVSGKFIVSTE